MKRRIYFLSVLGALCASLAVGAVPAWIKAASDSAQNSNLQDAPAVVLLDEVTVDVTARGVATVAHRKAIKVLKERGSQWAHGAVAYNEATDRVRTTNAWIVRAGEDVKSAKKSDWVDFTETSLLSLCGDIREKRLNFHSFATSGDVFAFETVTEGPLLEAQLAQHFDSELPSIRQNFHVTVPAGFRIEHVVHAAADIERPMIGDGGRTLSWILRDRPMWIDEPYAPDSMRLAPAIGVMIVPESAAVQFAPAVFKTWSDVGAWQEKLQAGQCDTDPALTAKVRALTESAPDVLSKIRALSVFVQELRYVSNEKDIGKGYGYKPRQATVVLERAYGDCKDKSNLLRAMLRELGIKSYLACARSEENFEVWPDFPSLSLFDHAIVAIEVGPELSFPSIVETKDRRLLFFDPTDPHTMLGDLPQSLQGTSVALMTGEGEALVTLPNISGEAGPGYRRVVSLKALPEGLVVGHAKISATGQAGADLRRRLLLVANQNDLDQIARKFLSDALRSAHIEKVHKADDPRTGVCELEFDFGVPNYLQRMPGSMAVARLDLLGHAGIPNFSPKTRKNPVVLRPVVINDEISFELPPGMSVDDLPGKSAKKTSYGSYERFCEQRENVVVLKRRADLVGGRVDVAEYPALRQFLADSAKAERATVLLKVSAGAPVPASVTATAN
ncbi:MAG TPA: DUF3857 domain-containing protein [Opitutaceae bacterium]|nr:DUF3857 domain-containing protein [Opitutaceae bacterium]